MRALAIFGVAFAARLWAIWQLGDLPISRTPQLDSLEYLRWAERIAAEGFVWVPYPEHAPGYSFFVGAMLASSGGSLFVVRIAQALVASMSCVLTARIAGRTLTPHAFMPAGLLQALYAPFLYLDTALLSEPLLIFFILLAIDLATREDSRRASWFCAGLSLGAASIVRPTALVLLPIVFVAAHMTRRSTPPRGIPPMQKASLALVGLILVVAPVVIENWRVTGVPMIQAYGGMNIYLGNTPRSDGGARARLGGTWDQLEADASRAGTSRNEQDRYFLRRTVTEIGDAPFAYLALLANKSLWLVQQEELRDTHSLYFFRTQMPALSVLPGFGFVLALAAVALLSRKEFHAPRVVLWSIALLSATVVFLVLGLRYRAPLVPFVIMLAGAAVARAIAAARRAEWRHVGIGAAIAALVFTLANVRRDGASHNLAEEWALTGLSLHQEGDEAGAEQAYRLSLALDERSALAWDGLGVVLQSRGQHAQAREAFERAVGGNDAYALGWYHVATARDQAGDVSGAILAFRRALAVAPERTDMVLAFGLILHREGRLDEAAPFLEKAAARGEGQAHFALALTAMQRRDLTAARRHAREAARLMPDYSRAQALLELLR